MAGQRKGWSQLFLRSLQPQPGTGTQSVVVEAEHRRRWRDRVAPLGRDDGGAHREELDDVRSPAVALLLELDAHDALGWSSSASFCIRSIASSLAS